MSGRVAKPSVHGVDAEVRCPYFFPSFDLFLPCLGRFSAYRHSTLDANRFRVSSGLSGIGRDLLNRGAAFLVGRQLRKPAVTKAC